MALPLFLQPGLVIGHTPIYFPLQGTIVSLNKNRVSKVKLSNESTGLFSAFPNTFKMFLISAVKVSLLPVVILIAVITMFFPGA